MVAQHRDSIFKSITFGVGLSATLLSLVLSSGAQQNQFGGQDRADAARRMIVLAVQQGIDSLPPVSGQAFGYDYDPATDAYVRSTRLGPTALRSAQTVGEGKLSLRVATSYFELNGSFGPIPYQLEPTDQSLGGPRGFAAFGLAPRARVGLINVAASYGLTNRIEVTMNLPLVVADAHASESFTTRANATGPPVLSGTATREGLDAALRSGALVFRSESFRQLGFDFNEGTHAGVGRISIGGKGVLYTDKRLRLALAPEIELPSPNEGQFAGSATGAILGRLLAQVAVVEPLKLHLDTGYDYDFTVAELRRFMWTAGASLALKRVTVDTGLGGSLFDTPIVWTPRIAHGAASAPFVPTTATAIGDNELAGTFIDWIGGAKVRLTDSFVLSGTVDVPLGDQGFRPSVIGTLAIEHYL